MLKETKVVKLFDFLGGIYIYICHCLDLFTIMVTFVDLRYNHPLDSHTHIYLDGHNNQLFILRAIKGILH